ncbi:MAG: sulfurtransferase complex subunit TusC [Rhodospirillales bacterium]
MEDELQDQFDVEGVKKRFMYVNRKAPYGTIYAQEVLESVLISAAFEQHAVVAFLDDGVYQIKKGQDTKAVNMKNFSPTFKIIEMEKEDADEDPDMDMEWRIVVEKESMEARGLTPEDFVVDVEVLSSPELGALMEEQDVILSG